MQAVSKKRRSRVPQASSWEGGKAAWSSPARDEKEEPEDDESRERHRLAEIWSIFDKEERNLEWERHLDTARDKGINPAKSWKVYRGRIVARC